MAKRNGPTHFRVMATPLTAKDRQDFHLPQEVSTAFWWVACDAQGKPWEGRRETLANLESWSLERIRDTFGADRLGASKERAVEHGARWSGFPQWNAEPEATPDPGVVIIVLPGDAPVPAALVNRARLIVASNANGSVVRKANGANAAAVRVLQDLGTLLALADTP